MHNITLSRMFGPPANCGRQVETIHLRSVLLNLYVRRYEAPRLFPGAVGISLFCMSRTCLCKVKVKLSLCLTKHHAMKTYWGNGGIVPRILDLGTRWRWAVSFILRPLYPQGKMPWYPLDRRLGVPQSRSGRGGEEKNFQPLPGIEP
jgi:hypothetical protein